MTPFTSFSQSSRRPYKVTFLLHPCEIGDQAPFDWWCHWRPKRWSDFPRVTQVAPLLILGWPTPSPETSPTPRAKFDLPSQKPGQILGFHSHPLLLILFFIFHGFTIKVTIHVHLGKSEKCRKVKIRKKNHHPQPHHPETIIVKVWCISFHSFLFGNFFFKHGWDHAAY